MTLRVWAAQKPGVFLSIVSTKRKNHRNEHLEDMTKKIRNKVHAESEPFYRSACGRRARATRSLKVAKILSKKQCYNN